MKKITVLTLALASLAGSASAQIVAAPMENPPPGYAPPPVYAQQPLFCQPYTDNFRIGKEVRVTHGTACLQPDGSWELHPAEAPVTYLNRNGGLYLMPVHPFILGLHYYDHHHEHEHRHEHDRDHDHDHDHNWHR